MSLVIDKLRRISHRMVVDINGKTYTAAQISREVGRGSKDGLWLVDEWNRILKETDKLRKKKRAKYRVVKATKKSPRRLWSYIDDVYNGYYTEQKFLGFWWFNIGMFSSKKQAEGFLTSCIEGDIFEKRIKWRKK